MSFYERQREISAIEISAEKAKFEHAVVWMKIEKGTVCQGTPHYKSEQTSNGFPPRASGGAQPCGHLGCEPVNRFQTSGLLNVREKICVVLIHQVFDHFL